MANLLDEEFDPCAYGSQRQEPEDDAPESPFNAQSDAPGEQQKRHWFKLVEAKNGQKVHPVDHPKDLAFWEDAYYGLPEIFYEGLIWAALNERCEYKNRDALEKNAVDMGRAAGFYIVEALKAGDAIAFEIPELAPGDIRKIKKRHGVSDKNKPLAPLVSIKYGDFIGKKIIGRKYFVPGFIPAGICTLLYGDGGLGKSTIDQMLQTAFPTQRKWLGVDLTDAKEWAKNTGTPIKSLGIYCEDDSEELLRRQMVINDHYGIYDKSRAALLDGVEAISRIGEDNFLMVFDYKGNGEPTPFFDQLFEKTMDERINLLILDPIVELFGGNEIVRPQVRQFMRLLNALARDIDKHTGFGGVLLNGHPSAEGMRSGTGTSGSTDWNNAARARMYLEPPPTQPGERADPDARILSVKKANYSKRGERIDLRYQGGVFVVDGQETEAGVVTEANADGEVFTRRVTPDDVFLELLGKVNREGRRVTWNPASPKTYAPKFFATDATGRRGFGVADFRAAMDRLFAAGRIINHEVGPTSKRREYLIVNPNLDGHGDAEA